MKVEYEKFIPIEIDHEVDDYIIIHRDHLNKFKQEAECWYAIKKVWDAPLYLIIRAVREFKESYDSNNK